jgi:actin-related protein 6
MPTQPQRFSVFPFNFSQSECFICSVFLNAIYRGGIDRRIFVSNEVHRATNISGMILRGPFENGFLINWDVQKVIWDHIFSKSLLNVRKNR